jgi:hypothetical protein
MFTPPIPVVRTGTHCEPREPNLFREGYRTSARPTQVVTCLSASVQGPGGWLAGEEPLDDLDGRLRALELGVMAEPAQPSHRDTRSEIQNGL